MDAAILKIKQGRSWLMTNHDFIGAMSLRLDPIDVKNSGFPPEMIAKCGFFATDGEHLFFNRERVLKESIENIAGVIAHEVGHNVLGHFARQGERENDAWQEAADHADNLLLLDAGVPLPSEGLADQKYKGWTAERVYTDIMSKPKQSKGKGNKPGNGNPDDGLVWPAQGNGDSAPEKLQEEWKQATHDAEQLGRLRGTLPAELAQALTKAREAPQDWRAMLRQFATDPCKSDYKWSPPNRRHIWRGAYLPGLRSEELSIMAVTLDSSGSCWGRAPEFVGEAQAMLESGIIGELVLIACDAQAHLLGRFRRGDSIDLPSIPGGGGTDFRPAFEMLEELGINPTCHAYLTDLEGEFPESAPGYATLWCTVTPGKAPFGTVVDMS